MTRQLYGNCNTLQIEAPDVGIGTEICCEILYMLFVVLSGKCILVFFNPLNSELNPICYLLALLDHHFLHVSRIKVKSLTLRLLMSYIYGAPIFDVSRSRTTTQTQSVGLLWTSDQLVAGTST